MLRSRLRTPSTSVRVSPVVFGSSTEDEDSRMRSYEDAATLKAEVKVKEFTEDDEDNHSYIIKDDKKRSDENSSTKEQRPRLVRDHRLKWLDIAKENV